MSERLRFLILILFEIALVAVLTIIWDEIYGEDLIKQVFLWPFANNGVDLYNSLYRLEVTFKWDLTITLGGGAVSAVNWYIYGVYTKVKTPAEVRKKGWPWGGIVFIFYVVATIINLFDMKDYIEYFVPKTYIVYLLAYAIISMITYYTGTFLLSPIVVKTAVPFRSAFVRSKGGNR